MCVECSYLFLLFFFEGVDEFCLECMLKKCEKTKTKTKIVKVGDVKLHKKKKNAFMQMQAGGSLQFSVQQSEHLCNN